MPQKMRHLKTLLWGWCRERARTAAVLSLLICARGSWVPLPEILKLGVAQYNARILELRRLGFTIENRTERVNGARHSWFRLLNSPAGP